MQYSFWHKIPIVRLLLPFAIGIGISMFYPIPFRISILICIVSALLALLIYLFDKQYFRRWLFGFIIFCLLLSGGFALHAWQNELRKENHYHYFTSSEKIILTLNEQPISKPTSLKVRCKVLAVIDSFGNQTSVKGSLVVYIQKDSNAVKLSYGDVLAIPYNLIKTVSPPQNPDEFNYKRYLAFNNIYFQAYVAKHHWKNLNINTGTFIQKWVYNVQAYFKSVLARCIASQNETGVAEALLYGYDDDIDPETVQAYSNTGTLHVLAVSGMHVGLIFMILSLFLKPLDQHKKTKVLKNILILCFLWLYSLLCGFSPSILRATVMFSFIILSAILNVRANIYNTLAASALILLFYDSNMLANVGFQLSYLAVIGIIFFQPLIYNWFSPSGFLVNELWKITAVSIAAQLITFPIGLLYFHQFPNCFLFSNLIIIPLTTFIIYLALVLLVFVNFSWLSWLIGQTLFHTIHLTNNIVKFVESIPFAYVNGIHISIIQSIWLYCIIGGFAAFLLLKQKVYLKITLASILLFTGFQCLHQLQNKKQHRILIYNINKHSAIHFIKGNEAYLVIDAALLNNKNKMKFHLQQHTWKSGINNQRFKYSNDSWQQIMLPNYSCLISGKKPLLKTPNTCDLYIIKDSSLATVLLKNFHPKQVVITSALKTYQAKKIDAFFSDQKIPVTYVGETGAIEVSLPN